MATNSNGHLVDDAGNPVIDHVWGNMPMQPNDQRTTDLDVTLDNHINAVSGWNGYPLYTPNTPGEDVAGSVDYVLVPSVLGLTTSIATKQLSDATLVVTAATAATNAASTITAVARTGTAATVTSAGSGAKYPTGTKITISGLSAPDTDLNGTWTVTGTATNSVSFTTTTTGTLSTTGLTVAGLVGTAGTIKTQSVAAGANEIAPATAVTITPWAAAS